MQFAILAAAAIVAAAPTKRGVTATYPGFANIQTIHAFGDSYTAMGFNEGGPGPYPNSRSRYGRVLPGVTSSYGSNWLEYLTSSEIGGNTRALVWDWAWNGAVTDSSITTPWAPTVHDLRQQISQDFAGNCTGSASGNKWQPASTLFITWTGQNDLQQMIGTAYAMYNGQSVDTMRAWFTSQIQSVVATYTAQLNVLKAAGATNILVMSLSALQYTPYAQSFIASQNATMGPAVAAQLNSLSIELIQGFNGALQSMVSTLQAANPGMTIAYFDAYTPMETAIKNPSITGASVVSGYCNAYANLAAGSAAPDAAQCNGIAPSGWFWLNTVHPTYPYHKYLAQQVLQLLQ